MMWSGVATIPQDSSTDTSTEEYYKWQCNKFSNFLILGDEFEPEVVTQTNVTTYPLGIRFINVGEVIAGSAMINYLTYGEIASNDIDIYFKSKDDAIKFAVANDVFIMPESSNNQLFSIRGKIVNAIWGVPYKDPIDLISKFDFRVSSIALDPAAQEMYFVKGAIVDIVDRNLVYNPTPRNTSIARLIKYTIKGFRMKPYQRLFLSELIKSSRYNPELELTTGY